MTDRLTERHIQDASALKSRRALIAHDRARMMFKAAVIAYVANRQEKLP